MMKDLEKLLAEFSAAEQAGVFNQTAQPVMRQEVTAKSGWRLLASPRWGIAAALAMALGVWTLMFRAQLSDVRDRSRMVQAARAADLQSALVTCSTGPAGSLSLPCKQVDFDRDGDVDLGDFSAYQRDLTGVSQ